MSQPDILRETSATVYELYVRFGNCARLSLAVQRYGWTVKQGERRTVCKQETRASTLSGAISTNARITKQIDDMREAVHQAPRRSYAA